MINWLLSLINKRQQQLYRENQKLQAQNRNYKMAYEELDAWAQSLKNHLSTMQTLTSMSSDTRLIEANVLGEHLRVKVNSRLKALKEKVNAN